MRKVLYVLCLLMLVACTCHDIAPAGSHSGRFALTLVPGEIRTELSTRAAMDVQAFKVTLTDNRLVPLMQGKVFGDITPEQCLLPVGTDYQISAQSCNPQEALAANTGWGTVRYVGEATFDIAESQTTPVEIHCAMANAGLQVRFDASFVDKFPIHAVTTRDSRALVFGSNNTQAVAYFNTEGQVAPTITLLLTGSKGGWDDRLNKEHTVALVPGKVKILTLKYNEGMGDLDVDIDTDTSIDNESHDVIVD